MVLFEISPLRGKFEHWPFFEKSPIRGYQTMLNGFAAPSGVFRLAPQLEKTDLKKLGTVLKSLQSWRGVQNYPFLRYYKLTKLYV